VLATITGALAFILKREGVSILPGSDSYTDSAPQKQKQEQLTKPVEKLESFLQLDPFQIELGYGLVSLADPRRGGDLLERVTNVRKNFAQEMGIIIPPIKLRDNLQLSANEYRFILKGNPIAKGELMPGHWLAMNASQTKYQLKGIPTIEPVFQLPAYWINDVERKNAEINGYTVVDASSVLITHLTETLKHHCHELLSRQDVQALLDNLKSSYPAVINELIPNLLSIGQIQRILQNLLAEGISIKNLVGILEKVADYAPLTKNPDELSEYARKAISHQIVKPLLTETGCLKAITLDPQLEQQIVQGVRQTPNEITLVMDPNLAQYLIESLSKLIQKLLADGHPPLVICSPHIRLPFRRFFEQMFPELTVLSYNDIPPKIEIINAGTIQSQLKPAEMAVS